MLQDLIPNRSYTTEIYKSEIQRDKMKNYISKLCARTKFKKGLFPDHDDYSSLYQTPVHTIGERGHVKLSKDPKNKPQINHGVK